MNDEPTQESEVVSYDTDIMNELLSQPDVRDYVLSMTSEELDFFKNLLIAQGTYARYCAERVTK